MGLNISEVLNVITATPTLMLLFYILLVIAWIRSLLRGYFLLENPLLSGKGILGSLCFL